MACGKFKYTSLLGAAAVALTALGGCERSSDQEPAEKVQAAASAEKASGAPAAPVPSGAGIPADAVRRVVNAENLPAYTGPTGTIRGRVVATGDKPPALDAALEQIPGNCREAREMFGSLFREGMNRNLADVLVAVTGYSGYVPARDPGVVVEGRGCAWDRRTVGMTFGQSIDVVSKDDKPYVPRLLQQASAAELFAVPSGKPIQLRPSRPGNFVLVDSMRLYNAAEVYVLAFSTFDVTGLDGRFEIAGVPAGEVKVNALLPITQATAGKTVVVEPNEVTTVDLELAFDAKAYEASSKKAGEGAQAGDASSEETPSDETPPGEPGED